MLKFDTIKSLDDDYVLKTYNRQPALFVQGAGCSLWDNRGNEYLDLFAGIAVNVLGHCHPAIVSAITRQAQQLMHTSNLLLTAPQAQLARRLCELGSMDKVFFTVCGATANETALKIAKKHGHSKRPDGDYEIVSLLGSFHGRTMGALSAGGQRKYQRPFDPLVPGFRHVPINDLEALRAAVGHKTAAILIEPIQGEFGIHPCTTTYLQAARELATQNDALLIFDEVQTGIGRTGTWFNYQQHDVLPDLVCLAKGLGGGFPIGAVMARGKAADILQPGDHGSTFGGNPLACAVALAVLDTIENHRLAENAQEVGAYLRQRLSELGQEIEDVRGAGLMVGCTLKTQNAREVVRACFDKKVILNATDDTTLRFVPPLILTKRQVDHAIATLADVLGVQVPKVAAVVGARPEPLHDVLAVDDLSDAQLEEALTLSAYLKQRRSQTPGPIVPVEGRTVALLFEKPSLRTRLTFETAVTELGGFPVFLGKSDVGLGQREAVKDIASNLAEWCSLIVARLFWQRDLEDLARHAEVPVVNALTELEHPFQALADMLTIRECFGGDKVKIAYVGDGNNVARSLAKVATRLGYPFTICGPDNFRLEEMAGVEQTSVLEEGLADAHVVYTDVWISMGDEHEQEHRLKIFDDYQVNRDVMAMASPDAIFMHCLPARRGFEVTDDVIDSQQSRVVQQAGNRLHTAKAVLQMILG
ncbi:MAG: acetylornithine transaminase [Fimbriimonadaceae bacterium]|nr:acetylornithine transaminase [Fimbriimonadaceae bacterium]